MRRRARTVLAAVVVAALVTTGCSLRHDERPREIASKDLSPVLREPNPTSTTSAPRSDSTRQLLVYLVQTDGTTETLQPVPVDVAAPADPAALPRVLIDRLVNNPPVSETSQFQSRIPPGTRVISVVQRADGVLDVDLSKLGEVEGIGQRLAVAQIVYTATELAGIGGVRFSIDGQLSEIPVDDGSAAAGTVIGRDHFPRLRPGGTATTVAEPAPSETEAPPP